MRNLPFVAKKIPLIWGQAADRAGSAVFKLENNPLFPYTYSILQGLE
jgi:hypothetical protein